MPCFFAQTLAGHGGKTCVARRRPVILKSSPRPGESMSRLAGAAALLAALGTSTSAQQPQQAPTPRAAASSFATVEVHVNARSIGRQWYAEDAALAGPARIAISYGQPHARRRRVVGGLIPDNQVWRFGA